MIRSVGAGFAEVPAEDGLRDTLMEELLLKRVLPEMMRGILSDRDEGLGNCLMVHRMMEGCCFYMLEAMVFFY